MKKSILIFIVCFANLLFAQKHTLSGYIKDSKSGETLVGAVIVNKNNPSQATMSNEYGFYSLTLPQGNYTIIAQYLGYQPIELNINLNQKIRKNIELSSSIEQLEEIEIKVERSDENVKSTDMGRVDLDMEKAKTLPVVFGEVDIMKTIQLLPGVQSSGEGNTGFYVRGGGPDQNLVLLDEAVVYNPGHLMGFFSVFNADAIKNSTLIKGGMPANYGGRLSSVLDISMKDGNDKEYHAEGGIGIISSRILVEGPIKKNKSSFMITGRRTYIDVLAKPFLKNTELGGLPYYFYDLNMKVNYRFSDKDRLYLSGYFGRDVANFRFADGRIDAKFNWGNATSTLRWNHLFNDKLFVNTSFVLNRYDFLTDVKFEDIASKFKSDIKDYNTKVDFTYFPSIKHTLKFGVNHTYHVFNPRAIEVNTSSDTFSNDISDDLKYAHEFAAYISDEYKITENLMITAGIRGVGFAQMGPFYHYQYNEFGFVDTSKTVFYRKGQKAYDFYGLEPRLSARYSIDNSTSVKAGYSYNHQFIHLVSNSYTTLPFDVWVPSSILVQPQVGQQISAGIFKNFNENKYETSLEVYYKKLDNQVEYGESYTPDQINKSIEYEFVFGQGDSYGAELFLNKTKGDFTGWIGYTLSWTNRIFPDINNGEKFPARFDRRHDLSVVGTYQHNKRWTFSTAFVYGTGQATTMPQQFYISEGIVAKEYGPRNSFRMEAYHRLDLSAILKSKPGAKLNDEWVFSVYNVYNKKNPFFYYIDTKLDESEGITNTAKKVYIFPILPSITWNFKF